MTRTSSWHRMSNFFRKYKKFPHSSFKTKWTETLKQKSAMEDLKTNLTTSTPTNNPIQTLITSFNHHNTSPTPQAYKLLIKTLTQTSQLNNIQTVLNHIESSENFDTPESIFKDVITAYGYSNRIEEAINVFFNIPKYRCIPSAYTLNQLLSVIVRDRRNLKLVPEILVKACRIGVRLEESTFEILIDSLCRIGEVDCATDLVSYMNDECLIVDPKLYSRLLRSVCKHKDTSKFDIVRYVEDLRRARCMPDLRDYTLIMRFLVQGGRGKEVVSVFNQMKREKIKVDIVCYTIVLQGVIADEDYEKADELFDELLLLGLVPDVYTYNVYINGLCKGDDIEGAMKIMYSMKKVGCEGNVVTYNILLKALVKARDMSRAKSIWKEMERNGVSRNSHTYDIMINAFIEVDDVISAHGLLKEAFEINLFIKNSRTEEVVFRLFEKDLTDKATELMFHVR